ncbi:MAG: ribonuclease III [Bacillota bacterium]|nr:ribonuclease III [Bacillota bacterium]
MNDRDFQKRLGYSFHRAELLETALTHSSFSNESKGACPEDNERLEFLGDAVFDLLISEYLYEKAAHVEEGVLTRLRAAVVCEASLARCGERLGVGRVLRLGRGEETGGGRARTSILADAMEAVIAAIYLDGGMEAARAFVLSAFGDAVEEAMSGKRLEDYKTELQEKLQALGRVHITYQVEREEGPDHAKVFHVVAMVNGKPVGRGAGKNKKEAEQRAAKAALEG